MRTFLRRSDGFTLAELMIVLALLSFVLAAIYAGSQAMLSGAKVNQAQATFARDSGEPMRIINKSLMQATAIEVALPNQIMVTTDRNLDNVLERVRVTATSDGRLTYEVWNNGTKPPATPTSSIAWSTNCVNVARGVPLFHDSNLAGSTQTETTGGVDTLAAKLVTTDLVLSYGGSDYRSGQSILLRNRQ